MNELWDLIFWATMIVLYSLTIAPILGRLFVGPNVNPNWCGLNYDRCILRGLGVTVTVIMITIGGYSIYLKAL